MERVRRPAPQRRPAVRADAASSPALADVSRPVWRPTSSGGCPSFPRYRRISPRDVPGARSTITAGCSACPSRRGSAVRPRTDEVIALLKGDRSRPDARSRPVLGKGPARRVRGFARRLRAEGFDVADRRPSAPRGRLRTGGLARDFLDEVFARLSVPSVRLRDRARLEPDEMGRLGPQEYLSLARAAVRRPRPRSARMSSSWSARRSSISSSISIRPSCVSACRST